MITDDIVILRLCPRRRCSSSFKYGCSSGYGEYAMDLVDYLKINMRYQYDRVMNLCNFCQKCSKYNLSNNRLLEDGEYYNIVADDDDKNGQVNEIDDANSQNIDDYYASVV